MTVEPLEAGHDLGPGSRLLLDVGDHYGVGGGIDSVVIEFKFVFHGWLLYSEMHVG